MSGRTGNARPAASWIFPTTSATPAGREAAGALLSACEETDQRLFALVYGYELPLGDAAWALELDPALAHWRMRAALSAHGGDAASGPGSLERGLASLLRAPGGPSDEARRIVGGLPAESGARLQSALDGTRVAAVGDGARPGLGVGSLVIVVMAVAAFLLYGVVRDANPLWHGKDMLRRGDYAAARLAFEELGELPEARGLTAIAWLAEGNYPRALELLRSPGAASFLAAFRPIDEPLETVESDPESLALLPRGLIATTNPKLVYRAGPAGEVLLLGHPLDSTEEPYPPLRIRVTDTSAATVPIVALSWPSDVDPLASGSYTWTVPGSELHQSSFTLLGDEQRLELESHARERLTNEIPQPAIAFLRAHYYLRNKLYTQAGQNFAWLARRFPDQAYPREMLDQVAAALGVDPSAFLR